MRRSIRLALVLGGVLAASALLAPAAEAQWRHRSRVRVFVGAHIGYPYYSPYYDPFFYRGFYGWSPYYWQGYYQRRWRDFRLDEDTVLVRPDVSPKDAQVYVDGYFRGSVSDFDGRFEPLLVEAGEHEIVVYLQGHRTARRTVQLRGGTVYHLREKLVRLPEGETSEPPPAPAPRAEQEPPAPGRAEPLPGRPAPDEPQRGIPRPPGEAPRVRPDVEARGFGSIAVRVQPAGAEILIDDERWQGPEGPGPLVVQLAQGLHRVEVRMEGYETFTTEVQVREGETVPVNVSLPRR